MRKHYSATFKAEAVKTLLKEDKTINQLASELDVHPSQLKEWKRIALQGPPELFNRQGNASEQAKLHEQQVNELYGEISRLTTQVNWLKKNLALTLSRSEQLGLADSFFQAWPTHFFPDSSLFLKVICG